MPFGHFGGSNTPATRGTLGGCRDTTVVRSIRATKSSRRRNLRSLIDQVNAVGVVVTHVHSSCDGRVIASLVQDLVRPGAVHPFAQPIIIVDMIGNTQGADAHVVGLIDAEAAPRVQFPKLGAVNDIVQDYRWSRHLSWRSRELSVPSKKASIPETVPYT